MVEFMKHLIKERSGILKRIFLEAEIPSITTSGSFPAVSCNQTENSLPFEKLSSDR